MDVRLNAISTQLQDAPLEYVPAKGGIKTIRFCLEGVAIVGEGDTAIQFKWSLTYSSNGSIPMLNLRDEQGALVCVFSLMPTGIWRGRNRETRGVELLRAPEQDMPRWKVLANSNEFERNRPVMPVRMPDRSPYEYVVDEIAWGDFAYNLAEQLKVENLPQSDTAVALLGCDRLEYFATAVQSIALNPEVKTMPVFLFLDRPSRESRLEEFARHVEVCREHLPQTVVIKRPRNFGCGRSLIDARIQLFENLGYDKVFMFEDDMVVSPQYVGLCLRMLQWANENYDNVGAVQAWDKCIMSEDVKRTKLSEVHATITNLWGYLMTRRAWEAIAPILKEYQETFLKGTYDSRPHGLVSTWFKTVLEKVETPSARCFLDDSLFRRQRQEYFASPPTGQDAATCVALHKMGIARLATTVNRGKYIGKIGIHMTPRQFQRDGFESIPLVPYVEDASLSRFSVRSMNVPSAPNSMFQEISHV